MKNGLKRLLQRQVLVRLASVLVIGLPFFFIGYTLYQNWQEITQFAWSINYLYLALSFVVYSLALGLAILSWGAIMRKFGGDCSFMKNARIYCLSSLARRIPGTLWYVAGRVYWYEKEGIPKLATSAGVLWEMIVLILSGFFVYLLSLPVRRGLGSVGSPYLVLLAVPLGLVVMYPSVLSRSLNSLLRRLGRRQVVITVNQKDTVSWLVRYALVWVMGGLILFLFVNAFAPIPLVHLPAVIGIWGLSGAVASLAFFVPAGLGIKEVTLVLLLSQYLPLSIATVLALLLRVWLTLSELIWTLVFLGLQRL